LRSFCEKGTPEQQLLAAESLSTADTTALQTLHRLLLHQDPLIRQDAIEVLAEDRDWQQASRLAPLLDDPSRSVRRAASVALMQMGAPGLIMLRRKAAEENVNQGQTSELLEYHHELAGSHR
jgi:HEAT repeat protein